MLTSTTIDAAVQKKFTEISDAVKKELHSKLNDHDDIRNYSKQFDDIQTMKNAFAEINKANI